MKQTRGLSFKQFKMVNGNYVLYGDRPSSESEIVDDHVQTRTAERKNKRKPTRTANELQRTLNMAQLDNETDSIKYEKKTKEPRLLRYVPTTDVEEHFVTEKFETYDLKPTEERPRRYAFQKKPKNPSDGSVNYAYSRSSSNCSSPNGNLPTISEHGEQYGTYRAQPSPTPRDCDVYEHKLDKYFYKPKDGKKFPSKVNYEGSHPDSLYRVQADSAPGDRMVRMLRVLRWPVALIAVCIALAVFVYFLMPDNTDYADNVSNQTLWEPVTAGAHNYKTQGPAHRQHLLDNTAPKRGNDGTKTPEIDFYDSENDKHGELTSDIDAITDTNAHRVLPVKPVFPSHIMLEVQYGNERTDTDKLRTPKLLDTTISDDSTLKPHITQKPEKPLAVYFKDLNEATTTTVETISRAETMNDFTNHANKQTTKKIDLSIKSRPIAYKDSSVPLVKPLNIKQYLVTEPENLDEEKEFFSPLPSGNIETNFTSGHSMLFGISIEDAEKMKSTTQSSTYNTRVSPTLPTWRDGDDSTTKHYPVNLNTEAPICRSTRYTLCRGVMPYDLAGFPVKFRGVDFSAFMPHIEYLVHTNCSNRARQFACALLEPECNPYPHQSKMPCYSLCRAIVDSCEGSIAKQLMPAFDCKRYGHTDCIAARSPCYDRELACNDGSCIPREWVCDNHNDCPGGEDETQCSMCAKNEYRCSSGGCILNRWLCDGYADCPGGEDEVEACDRQVAGELGEESAGSAPAPAVRRPNRMPLKARSSSGDLLKTGENDSSRELLVTSDSNNGFKRNFTRRPSLSRLSPYTRSTQAPAPRDSPVMRDYKPFPIKQTETMTRQDAEVTQKSADADSIEDINIRDLGIFDEIKKTGKSVKDESEEAPPKRSERKPTTRPKPSSARAAQVPSEPASRISARLDKSINKLEKVINGAALMQKTQAIEDQEAAVDSTETNITNIDKDDFPIAQRPGSISAHASPCPSGELRCVDGRCITLAQLCDGTIDCTDHADEDNCFT